LLHDPRLAQGPHLLGAQAERFPEHLLGMLAEQGRGAAQPLARGAGEPESIGGFIPLAKVYEFEPVPAALAEAGRKHILGGQGNLWGEYLWTPADVEYFAFPRTAALAEVLWSPANARDFGAFQQRLARHAARLDHLKVNYRRLDAPTSASNVPNSNP